MQIVLLVVLVAIGGCFLLDRLQAKPADVPKTVATRIAVCDVFDIFARSQRSKDMIDLFERQEKAINTEGKRRAKEIREVGEVLNEMKEGTEDYEKQFSKGRELSIKLRIWEESQTSALNRDRYLLTQAMYEEITKTIGIVAERRKIDIVLYQRKERISGGSNSELLDRIDRQKVLYSAKHVDITNAVLKHLSEAYKKP